MVSFKNEKILFTIGYFGHYLAAQDKKFKTEEIITSTWSDNTNNLSSVYIALLSFD